jgi:iron complex outermembrane recepter protein
MKKQLSLLLLISAFINNSIAQNQSPNFNQTANAKSSISGIITDAKSGATLPGATVYFPDFKVGAISDDKGYFRIAGMSNGMHLIEISYQGFATIIESIDINGETTHNFSLQPSVIEQEAVTVTGTSFATRLKQSPQPVKVIKHNDLESVSSSNIIDALSKLVPGVTALSTGPAIAKPFIRGLGYNRVLVINDGIRQEGQQWGDEHGIEIDDYSVQRIEVLKGPASLMYGSDAIAGVINIQSQTPLPEGTGKFNFSSEYQTNNKLRGFYGNIAGTKHGFSWNAYGSYKGAQDYKNKYDGYVFNSKFYNSNFGGMLAYAGSWGNSRFLLSNFDQRLGIVEGDRDETTGAFIKPVPGGEEAIATNEDFKKIKPEIPSQQIQHFKVTSDNVFNVGRNRLDVVVGYQQNQRQEFGNPDAPTAPEAYFDLKTINYAARFHFPSNKKWKTSVGITGMRQSNTNKGEEAIIPDYELFDIGAFVYSQYTKNKWSVSGGVRFDTRHVNGDAMEVDAAPKFNAFERNFSNVSGSLGLAYEASKAITLKFNAARGFRAPNLAELASNGAHEGTNRYELGDNNLKSEVSFQVDGGAEINTEHVSVTANVFYNNISRFIFYEKVQNINGGDSILADPETGDKLSVFRFNQSDAHLYGAEFNIDIHPHPLDWLHFENTFSYTRGQFKNAIDGSKNIPFIPAAKLVSELRGNFLSQGKNFKNFYLSISGDYTLAQHNAFTGYNTETVTGSYYLLNAGAGADITSKGKTIVSVHLSGFNLTNAAYQNHLSRLKYAPVNNVTGRQGVFDMGRNFSIKIDVPLTFKI